MVWQKKFLADSLRPSADKAFSVTNYHPDMHSSQWCWFAFADSNSSNDAACIPVSVSGHQRRMVQTPFSRSSCQKLKNPFRLVWALAWFGMAFICSDQTLSSKALTLEAHVDVPNHTCSLPELLLLPCLTRCCYCDMPPSLLSSFLTAFILLITFTDWQWFALVIWIVDTINIYHHRYHRFLHVPLYPPITMVWYLCGTTSTATSYITQNHLLHEHHHLSMQQNINQSVGQTID